MPEPKQKTKRQLTEDARAAALEGRWDDAEAINRGLVERYPREAEPHNRIGRAHFERGRHAAAFEAYAEALRLDPANMIARRNLQRLEYLRHRPEAAPPEPAPEAPEPSDGNGANGDGVGAPTLALPRTTVFVEEVGKTWVDELVDPLPMEDLALISSGQQLGLQAAGEDLLVVDADGRRLGRVDPRTAERVLELMRGGNRYEVYVVGLSAHSLRVILREVYRDPAQATKVSFPRQIKATRAYLRERDLLRQRDEADFLFADDDEDDEDEETAAADEGDELDTSEPEADAFIPDTVVVEEDEQQI